MLRVFFSCTRFVDTPAGAASSEVRLSAESPSIAGFGTAFFDVRDLLPR